jgi:hypothetical protein
MLALLLILLSQVTVTATWINVSDLDVSHIMTSLTSRTWSFFNVIVAFAWVIIVVWFIKLILKFIHKD